ncbi:MAG: NAD(P)/FAD-dependent oxidoreductase [archaeon]
MISVPITVIGGGVIGCAIAYQLSQELDEDIFVIEKNSSITSENQSSRNSGVIHAGIYYPKDKKPLKAKFCVKGNEMLYDFCEKFDVPYKRTGKLVVASNQHENEYLEDLMNTAAENNVPGVKIISGKEAKSLENNVTVTSALYAPSSGIIEATSLVRKLQFLSEDKGVEFVTGHKVVDIESKQGSFKIKTSSGQFKEEFETKYLINCAGLYSDEIARMVNPKSSYVIESHRGESAKFYKSKRKNIWMTGMNVYPVPCGYYKDTGELAEVNLSEFKKLEEENKIAKSIGVHLTPTFDFVGEKHVIGNTVTIGPIKTIDINKEDYGNNLKGKSVYLNMVRKYFPNLEESDIQLHQTGIMAVAKNNLDYVISRDLEYPNCVNLIGIDSPGLTSSLAIAKYVKDLMDL